MLMLLFTTGSGWIGYNYVENGGSLKKDLGKAVIYDSNSVEIEIPMGSNTSSIANLLKSKNLIEYPIIFKFISKYKGYDGKFQSGKHKVATGLTYQQIMDILVERPGADKEGTFTIPEGFALKQISQKVGSIKNYNQKKFEDSLVIDKFDYRFLKEIPKDSYANRKFLFEGYLFPDTYELGKDDTEETIAKKMLDQFNSVYKEDYYKRASELNMTVDQVITVASIIEREAKIDNERKIIASVIYNRLKRTDNLNRLQVDATIQYALLCKDGKGKELLLDSDLKLDDLYNTYTHEKLPPGPICSPGKKSIEAALYPDTTQYLYYVATGDGTGSHKFAVTYSDFLKFKDEYIKNLKNKK